MEEIKKHQIFIAQCLRIAAEEFRQAGGVQPRSIVFNSLREQFKEQAKLALDLARFVEDL